MINLSVIIEKVLRNVIFSVSYLLYCRLLEQGNERIGSWNVNVDLTRRNITEMVCNIIKKMSHGPEYQMVFADFWKTDGRVETLN